MLGVGDFVQTVRSNRRFQVVPRGMRGTVRSLEGDWLTIDLAEGGRFQTHAENVTRLLKARDLPA